jgi:hypothetical protein
MNKKKKPIKRGQNYIKEPPKTKDRLHWKVIFIGYIITYVISICVTGVPNLTYLIPIKADAIVGAGFLGLLSEKTSIKRWYEKKSKIDYNFSEARWRAGLYSAVVMISILIMGVIVNLLLYFGIITDITPFEGMFQKLN